MSDLPPLPSGFQLEGGAPQGTSLPPLPEGFQMEGSKPEEGITADNLVRSAAQGIPIIGGMADKFAAGMDALTQPLLGRGSNAGTLADRYAQNAAAEHEKTESFGAAHPVASTAANIAGGVASLSGAMKVVPALAGPLGFGEGSLLPNAVRGAASNAAIGGADAAVRGDDPVAGAEWGAGLGLAGPYAGRVFAGIANKIRSPISSASDVALQKVAAPLERAGINTPEELKSRLDAIGPEASIVDVTPESTQQAGAIAASPGDGQKILRDFSQERASNAGNRIVTDIDATMGKPVDLNALSDQIHDAASAKVAPLYKEAYGAQVQSTPSVDEALASPFGRQALASAKRMNLSDPRSPNSVMFSQAPVPSPAVTQLPDWAQGVLARGGAGAENLRAALVKSGGMKPADAAATATGMAVQSTANPPQVDVAGLHATRQAYDDMIAQAMRSGASKKAGILLQQRGAVDDVLKSVPEFKQADAIYSAKSKIQNAMAEGMNIYRNDRSPEDIRALLSNYSDAERIGYLQGSRVATRNVMGTARDDAQGARSLFNKGFNKEKLALAVGDDGASTILKRIGAENTYAANNTRITGGSQTAERLLAKGDLAGAHGLPDYRDVAIFSGVHGVIHRAVFGALQSAYAAITSGRQQNIEAAMAKLLTANGVNRTEAIQRVMKKAYEVDKTGRTNRLIAQIVYRLPPPSQSAVQSGQ